MPAGAQHSQGRTYPRLRWSSILGRTDGPWHLSLRPHQERASSVHPAMCATVRSIRRDRAAACPQQGVPSQPGP